MTIALLSLLAVGFGILSLALASDDNEVQWSFLMLFSSLVCAYFAGYFSV